jgi:diguanylate cyclase (GGDEF)-like protein
VKILGSEQPPPDLILMDWNMPVLDGFQVLQMLANDDRYKGIPVIMLTIKGEVEHRVAGLNLGADDYLPKPFADEELEARIFAAFRARASRLALKERNEQLEAMLQRVEAMAMTDPLTGLYNRRRFGDVLNREFAITNRYKNQLSCIMMDLDHFKRINDLYGHQEGDQVLQQVGRVIAANVREVDIPARYGGEEFAMLLPHTSKHDAVVVADRIAELVRNLRFHFGEDAVRLTASFGIASRLDVVSNRSSSLVEAADEALYQAKREGRDRVILYDPDSPDAPPDSSP